MGTTHYESEGAPDCGARGVRLSMTMQEHLVDCTRCCKRPHMKAWSAEQSAQSATRNAFRDSIKVGDRLSGFGDDGVLVTGKTSQTVTIRWSSGLSGTLDTDQLKKFKLVSKSAAPSGDFVPYATAPRSKSDLPHYQQAIREELARMGRIGVAPRHIEAFMRVEHSTLDGITNFAAAVRKAVRDYDAEDGASIGDRLAKSYGL
jgi:hypothetical protein